MPKDSGMKRATCIFIVGLVALFVLQSVWIITSYNAETRKITDSIDEMLTLALQREMSTRRLGNPKEKPYMAYKRVDTPPSIEEMKKERGVDTISLKDAQQQHIGRTYAEIFTQIVQDGLMEMGLDIRMHTLDSLFQSNLAEAGLSQIRYILYLYDADKKVKETVGSNETYPFLSYSETEMKPIGTKGQMFVQGKIQIPPTTVLQQMAFIWITSVLMAILLVYCMYYQFAVLRRAQRELKEREKTVHSAIHDLKTPLNHVFAILDYLEPHTKDKMLLDFIAQSKMQIQKLVATIESMLRVLKEQKHLNISEVDLPETIRLIEQEVKTNYPQKSYSFELRNPEQIQYFQTDAVRVERCLRNLLDNALKYADDGVRITVTLKQIHDNIQIAIQDTGWGIPKKAQKRLGEQFYRVENKNKPNRQGLGIGLSSVMLLCKELKGKFSFRSKEGEGSVFYIELGKVK